MPKADRYPRTVPVDVMEKRLRNLALELTLAGGQVLKEHYGFTPEQVTEWIGLTTKQGQKNRAGQSL